MSKLGAVLGLTVALAGCGKTDGGSAGPPDGGVGGSGGSTGGTGNLPDAAPPGNITSCFAPCTSNADCQRCWVNATCTNGQCDLACDEPRVVNENVTLGASNPGEVYKVIGAKEINGYLLVEDALLIEGELRDGLRLLSCLERVTGNVQLGASSMCVPTKGCLPTAMSRLGSLTGLERLSSIGGSLVITGNSTLASLDPLARLTSVGSNLEVRGNLLLSSLAPLRGMKSVPGDLVIAVQPALRSLDGLGSITSIGGGLEISGSSGLTNLSGLDAVESIGGDVVLSELPALASVDGLSRVPALRSLQINNAARLADLRGLTSLKQLGSLGILGAPLFSSLVGLEALSSLGSLSIQASPLLSSLAPLANTRGRCSIFLSDVGVQDLSGLEGITEGGAELHGNPALTGLKGLENLTTAVTIDIRSNPKLVSIAALSALRSIEGDLSILENELLASLSGLERLTVIKGNLAVSENPLISSLAPLSTVRGSVSGLFIAGGALTDLHGLEGITATSRLGIGSSHVLSGLGTNSLTSLRGLEGITSVDDLSITENTALVELNGLSNLASVGNQLAIHDNSALKTLGGLSGISSIGGELFIHDNPSLPACEADAFARRVGVHCADQVSCSAFCLCPSNAGTGGCP